LYSTTGPHLVTQAELNDVVPDLDFPKTKAHLLGSLLRQCHLLRKECESVVLSEGAVIFDWRCSGILQRHLWIDGRTSATICP
jgi:hypothetical protein